MSIHQRIIFSYPTSAPTPTDPYFSDVGLLLNYEGTVGLQDFTDASSYAASPASIDATVVISSTAKYGSGGLYCPLDKKARYTGSRFTVAANTAFTLETHFRVPSASARADLFQIGENEASNRIILFMSATGELSFNRFDSPTYGFGSTLAANTWYHIAFVRNAGARVDCYVDGVLSPTYISDGGQFGNGTGALDIHPFFADAYFDNTRFTAGRQRYTTNFTPPSSAYPTS